MMVPLSILFLQTERSLLMNCRITSYSLGLLAGVVLVWCGTIRAEEPKPTKEPFRKLAPGVMTTVPPSLEYDETVSRHDVIELLTSDSTLDWAKDVPFRRDIWCLEFRFKPVRMIYVDIPQPNGKMRRELIWYMVYSVTNKGEVLHPVPDENGTFKVETVDKPVRFIPEFLLESPEFHKVYADRVIPLAVGPIQQREDPNRKLLTTVEMCREIAVGETVWGVVTWNNLDPRIDRFSIYIQGLTNAYRWKDEPGVYKKGDPLGKGRRLSRKTLKLNFWRPGDEYAEHEREIRLGIPGEVDYEWVYR